jgi:hypothetical protein
MTAKYRLFVYKKTAPGSSFIMKLLPNGNWSFFMQQRRSNWERVCEEPTTTEEELKRAFEENWKSFDLTEAELFSEIL